MIEALQRVVPFVPSRERAPVKRKDISLFSRGRWGFRYDPKQKEGWRRIGEEHRSMIERNPYEFERYLQEQSPAEQYAVLELLSQPAFGRENNGEAKSHLEPKQIGELYAGLIASHFRTPSGSQEEIAEAMCRKEEFIENSWRLTVPQTALMFTLLRITPELSSSALTEDIIPYTQGIIHHMGEQAKLNLGAPTISQLESMGVIVGLSK